MNKQALRQIIKASLQKRPFRLKESAAIVRRLLELPEYTTSQRLMAYYSIPGEPELKGFLAEAVLAGKIVAVPRVRGDQMQPRQVTERFAFAKGRHGWEGAGRPVPVSRLDVVIVPGIAFDRRGQRLGRGGGHYDRFLATLNPCTFTIGVAFADQIVTEIPKEEHDQSVDMVITENELIRAAEARH